MKELIEFMQREIREDRAGSVTKYEYDASGRRIKTIQSYATMDLADVETLVTDPADMLHLISVLEADASS